jgi:hypothetical protein
MAAEALARPKIGRSETGRRERVKTALILGADGISAVKSTAESLGGTWDGYVYMQK